MKVFNKLDKKVKSKSSKRTSKNMASAGLLNKPRPKVRKPAGKKIAPKSPNKMFTTSEAVSNAAVRAFFKMATLWKLTNDEQIILLGQPSRSKFFEFKRQDAGKLSVDQLDRVVLLMGIFEALSMLYPNSELAYEWLKLPNNAPLFKGESALAIMLKGGIPVLFQVRRYLDAQCA